MRADPAASARASRFRPSARRLPTWLCAGMACVLALAAMTAPVFADSAPVASFARVMIGFRGYFRKNTWVPVLVQVHNTGPAASAQLTATVASAMGVSPVASGVLQWPVDLPAHQTVTKQIMVPGSLIGDTTLHLLVGGRRTDAAPLSGNQLGNVALVAVLSSQVRTAQTLLGSEDGVQGAPVLPVDLAPGSFPATVDGMSGLTALVATPENLADLTAQQASSVRSWVRLGGLLVITGTTGESNSWQSWYPLGSGPQTVVSGQGLDKFVGGVAARAPKLQVNANAASLRAGSDLWASVGSVPLIAERNEGRGAVVQTSFSPSAPALLVWTGNGTLWTTIFKMGAAHSLSALPDYLSANGVLSLASAGDVLAPLRVPSLWFWASLFGIYAVLMGPVLFLVLRKLRREPLAWVVLPVFSVLVTGGIYLFGDLHRPTGLLTEAAGVLDLVGNGQAEAYGVRAIMSPRTTTFHVQAEQSLLALPLREHNTPLLEPGSVVVGKHATTVTFRRVVRWGVRYTYLAGAVSGQGGLQATLSDHGGHLAGTVRNRTPYALTDLAVGWNGRLYELGNLMPGEAAVMQSKPVLKTDNWLGTYGAYNRSMTRSIGRSLGVLAGSEHLLDADIGLNNALLVATTVGRTPALGTVGAYEPVASNQMLTLVRQFATVDFSNASGVRRS